MHQIRKCWLLIIVVFLSMKVSAQTIHENTGWFAWSNSYKLPGHLGFQFDVHIRSADDWSNVRATILRPGITYFINAKNNVAVGYGYILTNNTQLDGSKNTLSEHRIWEQYTYNTKFGRVSLQNRLRLEQRFIERTTEQVFAQRLRYLARTIIPVAKQNNSFTMGFYAALQNELFLNIQNKDKINNSFFDQNRLYGGIGYRFNPKVDLEAGFMNQYSKGRTNDVSNNIIQMALYTKF